MNRDIKFRGLRSDGKGWVYGYYSPVNIPILGCLGHCINEGGYRAIDIDYNSLGQYTTYNDNQNKELYEGDICKDRFGRIMQVEFFNGRLQFRCDDPGNNFKWADMFQWLNKGKGMAGNELLLKVEIIGNIYQNQELLKGGSENG